MQYLIHIQISWTKFFTIAITLLLIYLFIKLVNTLLMKTGFPGRIKSLIKPILHNILLAYELFALVVLVGAFILVYPLLHGIIVLLFFIGGMYYVKNYIGGRIILFDKALTTGTRLNIQNVPGQIVKLGRIGLKLRTDNGLQFVNYSKLVSEGYTLLSGKEISGVYNIQVMEGGDQSFNTEKLTDLWASTPYIDWSNPPNIQPGNNANQINLQILVKDESHLGNFMELMKEWGYQCKVT